MGDRANIVINTRGGSGPRLYLYTHSGGFDLPIILRRALIRGEDRWGDESYLARIIFSEMIQDNLLDTTEYGLSTLLTDNERPLIIVDRFSHNIWLEEYGQRVGKPITFHDFTSLPEEEDDYDTAIALWAALGAER